MTTNFMGGGWYRPSSEEPRRSIGPSVTFGDIGRHYDEGCIWVRGRGRMRADHAIEQGIIDEGAAAYLANLESCRGTPVIPAALIPPPKRRATPYEGTPTGALIAAFRAFLQMPTGEDATKALGDALVAYQASHQTPAP